LAAAAAAIAATAVSACSSSPKTPPNSPPDSTSPATTAIRSTSAPAPSPSDRAKTAAIKTVSDYFALLDRVATNPNVPLNDLHTVSIEPDFPIIASDYGRNRSLGYKQTGTTKVVRAVATRVTLTNSPSAQPPVYPIVTVTACIDVSSVVLKDSHGARVGIANRPNFYVEKMTLINPSYPDASSWRVSNLTNKAAPSC
jgi:hypothetical protein